MEQLTQPELHQLGELLRAETLAVKKAEAYGQQVQDQDLKQVCRHGASVHKGHVDDLLKLLHQFSGGVRPAEGR